MDDIEKLAKWLKANDSLGGSFERETDQMASEWSQAHTALAEAISQATVQQVAEDEILFTEAVTPIKSALSRVQKSLSTWQAFLDKITPDIKPLDETNS